MSGNGFLVIIIVIAFLSSLAPAIHAWIAHNRCPKCGGWFCLRYITEVVTDKVVGHDRHRSGGSVYGIRSSSTRDNPFIRYWVEERYICNKCKRHVSIHTRKDRR